VQLVGSYYKNKSRKQSYKNKYVSKEVFSVSSEPTLQKGECAAWNVN